MIGAMTREAGEQSVGSTAAGTDARSLVAMLVPALVNACDGRLGDLAWFRTDWQRGGAATGFATWRDDAGRARQVVVKIPVNTRELQWTTHLQRQPCGAAPDAGPLAPILYASDSELGGYDFAWIVIERLTNGPLAMHWRDDCVPRIARGIARFYQHAAGVPVDRPPRHENWPDLVHRARENVRINELPDHRRWQESLRSLEKKLASIVQEWDERHPLEWLHGDLHPANAMCRGDGDHADVVLLDFAEVHPGHWVEDAIYLERLLWARPERLKACRPLKAISEARKALHLPVEGDIGRLATIRRVLLASTAPAFMKSEGNHHHLAACLARLEEGLKQLHCA
jgi:hypothetical protein